MKQVSYDHTSIRLNQEREPKSTLLMYVSRPLNFPLFLLSIVSHTAKIAPASTTLSRSRPGDKNSTIFKERHRETSRAEFLHVDEIIFITRKSHKLLWQTISCYLYVIINPRQLEQIFGFTVLVVEIKVWGSNARAFPARDTTGFSVMNVQLPTMLDFTHGRQRRMPICIPHS